MESKANENFRKYHMENLEIYETFSDFTMRLIDAGQKHYGAKAVIEAMRYKSVVQGNDALKINNTYVSRYARLFEARHPAHKGFFETRELKS